MTDVARNRANRKKALVAANIVVWLFQGIYTVSPIDLIPDLVPLIGWMDDAFGLALAIAFTVYTVAVVRRHGVKALLPGPAAPSGEPEVLTIEEIERL